MQWLFRSAAVIAVFFASPITVSGYSFGDWASDSGYSPGDAMPLSVFANDASIDSLNGIGDYNWDATESLYLDRNWITVIEPGDFSQLRNLQILFLGSNLITSIEAGDFDGPENLKWLYLPLNPLGSLDAGDLAGLESLDKLSLTIGHIDPGALGGLRLDALFLSSHFPPLTSLDLTDADFTRLLDFHVDDNWSDITSASLKNSIIDQASLAVLMDGGSRSSYFKGIGEQYGVTSMNLSGIDFSAITDLSPLYVMDDLNELWLAGTENLSAADLDTLLDNLETMERTATEGVLYMTQADYDDFNAAGGGMLASWDAEPGHHVSFVLPGDFNIDGHCTALDFLTWQRDPNIGALSDWEQNYGGSSLLEGDFDGNGVVDALDFLLWQRNPSLGNLAAWEATFRSLLNTNSAAVPESGALLLALTGIAFGIGRRHR